MNEEKLIKRGVGGRYVIDEGGECTCVEGGLPKEESQEVAETTELTVLDKGVEDDVEAE